MPSGSICSVVGCSSTSHNAYGQKINNGQRFFRIPKVKIHHGEQIQAITERRRRAWVSAIRRTTITFHHSPVGARVCSRHFNKGAPAYEMAELDPDWAPSLHLGHTEVKPTNASRYDRAKRRALSKAKQTTHTDKAPSKAKQTTYTDNHHMDENHPMDEINDGVDGDDSMNIDHGNHNQCHRFIQTDFNSADMDALNEEVNRLREENRILKEAMDTKEFNFKTFENTKNSEKVLKVLQRIT